MLLAFSGNLHATLVEDADPKIEILGKSQFAFDLDGSRISVEIRDRVLREKRDILLDWVVYSAKAVLHYYGRFPVRSVHIDLLVTDGPAVRFGRAFGGEAPMIRINVGEDINPEMLRRDWVLVHEMVHLAMADVPQQRSCHLRRIDRPRAARTADRGPDLALLYRTNAAGAAKGR
jgi:hypothetical protein